jgi:hypothetical protein
MVASRGSSEARVRTCVEGVLEQRETRGEIEFDPELRQPTEGAFEAQAVPGSKGVGWRWAPGSPNISGSVAKPIVFFSHSTSDGEALRRLKERFVTLTSGSVDVFLSSDGQSIRLGKNWVASVEQALKKAKVMFTFVTPNSIGSPWLYFESGVAYGNGTDVVPVGLFGVDVGDLHPPLSLLQGFNVKSHESLNNIITKTNETCGINCTFEFNENDFAALQSAGPLEAVRMFGEHVAAIVGMTFTVDYADQPTRAEKLKEALEALGQPMIRGYGYSSDAANWSIPGAAFRVSKERMTVEIDPLLAHTAMPLAEQVIHASSPTHEPDEPLPYWVVVEFRRRVVHAEFENHRLLGRVQGTGILPSPPPPPQEPTDRLRFGDLLFTLSTSASFDGPSSVGLLRERWGDPSQSTIGRGF